MKKALILATIFFLSIVVYLLLTIKVSGPPKDDPTPSAEVNENYYYDNVSIKGDTIILSEILYRGGVGNFDDERAIQKWHCPDLDIRKAIAEATIDFHQQPGELKMLATAKGLTNEKYLINAKFTKCILVKNNKIIKFDKKGKK